MKYRVLDIICCPVCKSLLHLKVLEKDTNSVHVTFRSTPCSFYCGKNNVHIQNGTIPIKECHTCYQTDIKTGVLECACGAAYEISDFVPKLLCREHLTTPHGNVRETYNFLWDKYGDWHIEAEAIAHKISERFDGQLSQLHDKVVLDAGCGTAVDLFGFLKLGAEVIAFDISDVTMKKALHATDRSTRTHFIQGDILQSPFRKGCVDIVYSHGMIHHTSNARSAFSALADALKEKGIIFVSVYRYLDGIERLNTVVRSITSRLPHRFLYALVQCYQNIGRTAASVFGKNIKWLFWDKEFPTSWFMFDWLSPEYQSHHRIAELHEWGTAAGIRNIKVGISPHSKLLLNLVGIKSSSKVGHF